jgi:hypothetical protein
MKFKFIISKWSNFYFFIQNLAEWHFSCRKNYNTLWYKELGNFSREEKKVLEAFKKIRSRYKPAKTCFEKAFFTKKNPWQLLTTALNPQEYQNIQKVFIIFQNKFEKFYSQERPLLEKWQKLLNKTANKRTMNRKITKILGNLYKTHTTNRNVVIKVYLLPSSPDTTGGGANIDNRSISLEISRYPQEKSNHALGIIWHEAIHLFFGVYYFPIIVECLDENKQSIDIVNELIVGAIFPRGVLGRRLLKNKPPVKLLSVINEDQTKKILSLVQKYIDKPKPFDRKLIQSIVRIIK